MLPCAPPLPVFPTTTALPLRVQQHAPAVSSRRRHSHDRPPLSPLSSSTSSSAAAAAAAAAAPVALELGWSGGAERTDTHMHCEDSAAEAQLLMLMERPPLELGLEQLEEVKCGEGSAAAGSAVAVHSAFQRWNYQFTAGGLAGKGAYGFGSGLGLWLGLYLGLWLGRLG